ATSLRRMNGRAGGPSTGSPIVPAPCLILHDFGSAQDHERWRRLQWRWAERTHARGKRRRGDRRTHKSRVSPWTGGGRGRPVRDGGARTQAVSVLGALGPRRSRV